ncbi:MAG: Eco57I restriction-modification methylase domain-containing protein [Solirubrobacterales bacterium]
MDVAELLSVLGDLWSSERLAAESMNESQTEERLIKPTLTALGFSWLVQPGMAAAGRRVTPDFALFTTDANRALAAESDGRAQFERAAAVADAKHFGRPLDSRAGESLSGDPVAQILTYMVFAGQPWGILTNGRHWRLYSAEADRAEAPYLEIDVAAAIENEDLTALRIFLLFFGAQAFTAGPTGRTFLAEALAESFARTATVGEALVQQVKIAVPLLATGLLGSDPRTRESLDRAYTHALVVLYRILFCAHAEGRGLLPIGNTHYEAYSARAHSRKIAAALDGGRVLSSRSDDLHNDLRGLFRMVDLGEPDLGVNEYDGGLFNPDTHPWLKNRTVPDSLLAPAADRIYRVHGEFVDYADLAVRHLGTVYEHLLRFMLAESEDGDLELVENPNRKSSGVHFTPVYIVDHIVRTTLDPVFDRCSNAAHQAGLSGEQALHHFLEMRVLDPAMGSGHFLVSATAHLARRIADDPAYADGDLGADELRRLVAERSIYGVDLDPLAVELARVSLWLTTVRDDEPLTFLHNLREGNSLVGTRLADLLTADDIFADQLTDESRALLEKLGEIDSLRTSSGTDADTKRRLAEQAAEIQAPLLKRADRRADESFSDHVARGRPFHWELEFPEIFLSVGGEPLESGGFDAVIGNPPYVRIQDQGPGMAQWTREHFETASGSFDTYIPFVERGIELMAPSGRLGFILPNKFFKLDYGKKLRERLAGAKLVEEILDFGGAQVFEDATTYTCVLLLDAGERKEFTYRRVEGEASSVRAVVSTGDLPEGERFAAASRGKAPWVLVAGDEADVYSSARKESQPLDEVVEHIFVGLQTSADSVFIAQNLGRRAGFQVVWSKASESEHELEPELLRPIASGGDVGRYAFDALDELLLFPYSEGDDGDMRLMPWEEIERLEATRDYFLEHEQLLRDREGGKMDRAGWWGYVYPKNLGSHDEPKLGIPRLCDRLRASVDATGGIYLDNVDVNGLLPKKGGPRLLTLSVLLNSRLLDWIFRRHSVPFQNDFWSANKQFIAPLPIRVPDPAQESALVDLGSRLHEHAAARAEERREFLAWLEGAIGCRIDDLEGKTRLRSYFDEQFEDFLAILRRNARRLSVDPASRGFRQRVEAEHRASVDRIVELGQLVRSDEDQADDLVFELYELTAAQRALVDGEYA